MKTNVLLSDTATGQQLFMFTLQPSPSVDVSGRIAAACFYRRSSVLCPSVTIVNPAKTAEPIKMSFGRLSPVGPRYRCTLAQPGECDWVVHHFSCYIGLLLVLI